MGQRWYEGREDRPSSGQQDGCAEGIAGLMMYLALIGLILLCILALASMAIK